MVPSARDALISYWRHLFESAPFILPSGFLHCPWGWCMTGTLWQSMLTTSC